jgi:hypothetical protein
MRPTPPPQLGLRDLCQEHRELEAQAAVLDARIKASYGRSNPGHSPFADSVNLTELRVAQHRIARTAKTKFATERRRRLSALHSGTNAGRALTADEQAEYTWLAGMKPARVKRHK